LDSADILFVSSPGFSASKDNRELHPPISGSLGQHGVVSLSVYADWRVEADGIEK